ncbi:PREDICTED: leucine-rich repeat-containing protein 20 [Nanorana parkeri]|uniref:leucine-rich repeat-containing protein 20 n=1 Tax=Nanorana parkeri TaxID=125878 RepID=UPI00085422A6|nr:PREDICTED: leucine-rich repeat-containing protein 20 [Nanorana parkeri]
MNRIIRDPCIQQPIEQRYHLLPKNENFRTFSINVEKIASVSRTSPTDLSDCDLTAFPIGIFLSLKNVSGNISSISLANNELKSLPGKFFTTFQNLEDLDLEGNLLQKLPVEVGLLPKLKKINLSRNKFEVFPGELTKLQGMESINLEGNQIKDIPLDELKKMPQLSSVNVKMNPVHKECLNLSDVKFEFAL